MAQPPRHTSIELTLFAPNNLAAALTGSFSDWADIPMKKGKDGNFRVKVDLADGEHHYRFHIQSKSWFHDLNQWVMVIDPYATRIAPDGESAVLTVRNGERVVDPYVWRNDLHPLPADRELIIYEIHIGDFSGREANPFRRGNFDDVAEKLDYLSDLGVNAIELMPVMERQGEHGWGYNTKYLMAPEAAYGSPDRLKFLIDECHGRGIRVILDGVFNHSASKAPLTQIDHDYWYHHEPKDPEMNWGPEFNYDFTDTHLNLRPARRFVGDAVRFWIREYHIDGFRFDAAKQIDNIDFLHWIVGEVREAAEGKFFYNVAEYIPLDPALCDPDGPMDGCWNESFRAIVNETLLGEVDFERLKNVIDSRRTGYGEAKCVVNYLGSHDQERLVTLLKQKGLTDEAAFRRVRLGMAILLTSMGIPMLWMGDEFGFNSPKTEEPNLIDWGLLSETENRHLHEYQKSLIRLRNATPALRSDNVHFSYQDLENKVLAYQRWSTKEGRITVVLNFHETPLKLYRVSGFPEDGIWREWSGAFEVKVVDGVAALDLEPFEACLLVK